MRTFTDKVAVVTGAASGIGLALAERLAGEGMKLVLADVEPGALEQAAHRLAAGGSRVHAVPTDVAKLADVEALAERALAAFGAVHVVCNNAGVAISGQAWTYTMADWQWVLGVNLWGVIHGVRVFTPLLLAHGEPAHMVNTASMAGVTCPPNMAAYNVSKHGVVALSETLHQELVMQGAALKVSVLCPSFTATRILDSARNRPAGLADTAPRPPVSATQQEATRDLLASGQSPAAVADAVLEAIRAERFYVFPHAGWRERVRTRMEDMLGGADPTPLRVEDFIR